MESLTPINEKDKPSAPSANGRPAPEYGACGICDKWADRRLELILTGLTDRSDLEDLAAVHGSQCGYCRQWFFWRQKALVDELGAEQEIRLNESQFPSPVPIESLISASQGIDFLWAGCIARRHTTLFSALMKSGKSTLLGLLLKALQSGSPFLGRKTQASRVLVISEESTDIWVARRDALGLAGVQVLSKPLMGKPSLRAWESFIGHIASHARASKADLVVIDTLGKFAPWKCENDAAEVQATLNPLDRITSDGAGLLCFHHAGNNESKGQGTLSRGSTALPGAVDIILEMKRFRPEEKADRRRVISGWGRFDDIPDEVVIELANDGLSYRAEGDRKAVAGRELHADLLFLLPTEPPGLTADELHDGLPEANRAKRATLVSALMGGVGTEWQSSGTGKKGSPRRFYRSQN